MDKIFGFFKSAVKTTVSKLKTCPEVSDLVDAAYSLTKAEERYVEASTSLSNVIFPRFISTDAPVISKPAFTTIQEVEKKITDTEKQDLSKILGLSVELSALKINQEGFMRFKANHKELCDKLEKDEAMLETKKKNLQFGKGDPNILQSEISALERLVAEENDQKFKRMVDLEKEETEYIKKLFDTLTKPLENAANIRATKDDGLSTIGEEMISAANSLPLFEAKIDDLTLVLDKLNEELAQEETE